MEPYPDRDEDPDVRSSSRGGIIAAVVIGGIFIIVVVLHLTAGISPHGP
jgi:hypothetical protein